MRNNPYGIDFKSEKKDYKKLCKGKSKKYKNYLEWRKNILMLIDDFDTKTLENFKHFCLYNEEANLHEMNIFLPLVICFISLLISLDINTNMNLLNGVVSIVIASIISSALVTGAYSSYIFSKNFYRDVAEIIKEKIESLPEEERSLIKINSDNSQKLLSSNIK